jgi:hypothetical protein
MSALRIHWHDNGTRDYKDIIPLTLFAKHRCGFQTHDVIGPRGRRHKAKFELSSRGREWTFDYEKFQDFNKSQGVGIGCLKLRFQSLGFQTEPEVSWRDQGDSKFRYCATTVDFVDAGTEEPFLVRVPIEIDVYRDPRPPFVRVTKTPPPKVNKLGRNLQPNNSSRQIWFQDQLSKIASSLKSTKIPWRFQTPSGEHWQLDQGAVGHAMANGYLLTPLDGVVLGEVRIRDLLDLSDNGARDEIRRRKRQGQILSRPGQQRFSRAIRTAYGNMCAVTKCKVAAALEAAHIRIKKGRDFNELSNGILLRADIHTLFDSGLITLTLDGERLEISDKIRKSSYSSLHMKRIVRPSRGAPSLANIKHHRNRFRKSNQSRPQDNR